MGSQIDSIHSPTLTSGCSVHGNDLHDDIISGGQVLDETQLSVTITFAESVGGSLKSNGGICSTERMMCIIVSMLL